jgi:hypothetical protein
MVIEHFKGGSSHVYESYDTEDGALVAVYELNFHQHLLDVLAMTQSWVGVNSAENDSFRLAGNKKSVRRLLGWLRELASHGWMLQQEVQELIDGKTVPKLNLLYKRHIRGEVCATNELRNLGWRDPMCKTEQELLDSELQQYVEYYA